MAANKQTAFSGWLLLFIVRMDGRLYRMDVSNIAASLLDFEKAISLAAKQTSLNVATAFGESVFSTRQGIWDQPLAKD